MIDIIIPAYNAHNTIKQTLFSIAYQDLIELCNIIIVNDNSDTNYDSIVNFFNNFMNIKELTLKENKGPGYARQYGIDHSSSKYIIFIDSDDILLNPYSIKLLYNEIDRNNLDIVISDFEEETDDEDLLIQNDRVWLHGKIYKRNFLEKNNIRFSNSRQNEDNGFNQLIFLYDVKYKDINEKTYLWRNNKNSITRKDNYSFRFDGIIDYIYNIEYALNQGIKDNCDKNKIAFLTYSSLVYLYFIYLEFNENSNINKILSETKKIFNILFNYPLSNDEKIEIYNEQYNNYYNEYTKSFLLKPVITFNNYLKLLEGENND